MLTGLLLTVAIVAGYLTGRTRPARALSTWAERLPWRRPAITRSNWQWWAAQPVYAAQIAVLLATRPRRTVHAWRTRNDPPAPISPPVRFNLVPREEP